MRFRHLLLLAPLVLACMTIPVSAKNSCVVADYVSELTNVRNELASGIAPSDAAAHLENLIYTYSAQTALQPVVDDLAGASPNVSDAETRLDAAIHILSLPAGMNCGADFSGARDALNEVYQSPAFAGLDQSRQQPPPGQSQNQDDPISRLIRALGPQLSIGIGALILGLILAFAIWRLRLLSAAKSATVADDEETLASSTSDDEWKKALQAASEKNFREAVRRAFRGALLAVAESGRMQIAPSWTSRELLQQLRENPELSGELAPASAAFDHAWYSGETVTETEWTAARGHCEKVRSLARRNAMKKEPVPA